MRHYVRRIATLGLMAVLAGCGTAPAPTPVPTPVPATATSALAAAPAATTAPTESATATAAQTAATTSADAPIATDLLPKQRSVWNTTIGQDQMSGNCTKGSVLPAYGLVQITPADAGLEWKNQEPKPYPMTRQQANVYAYAGPNSINDGVVTMTVTFVDDKNLTMLRQYTPNNDPGCTHTHEYKGVFQWAR